MRVQTARLLFRMSLMHLPTYLALLALHRVPNTGEATWSAVWARLRSFGTSAEQQLLDAHPAELRQTAASAGVPLTGMLFPFSPPVSLPCPYRELKSSVHPPAAVPSAGAVGARPSTTPCAATSSAASAEAEAALSRQQAVQRDAREAASRDGSQMVSARTAAQDESRRPGVT